MKPNHNIILIIGLVSFLAYGSAPLGAEPAYSWPDTSYYYGYGQDQTYNPTYHTPQTGQYGYYYPGYGYFYPPQQQVEKTTNHPHARPKGPPPNIKEGFAIHIGSFLLEDNAKVADKRVSNMGFYTYRKTFTVGNKNFFRVFAGPFATEQEAKKAYSRIKRQLKFHGAIVRYHS